MKNLNIAHKTQVLLSFEHKAYLLKSQSLVIQNTRLTDRVDELEEAAKLDKVEIAKNLDDYNDLLAMYNDSLTRLSEYKIANKNLSIRNKQILLILSNTTKSI